MPRRTLSPRISMTVTVMLSLIMMLSFFLRERTSIAAPLWYPSRSARTVRCLELHLVPGEGEAPLRHRSLAHFALIKLYKMKPDGQGDQRIFVVVRMPL